MKVKRSVSHQDSLIRDIMKLSEMKTKKEAVEKALEMYVNWLKRQKLRSLRGKIEWVGDLNKMRQERTR